MRQNNTDELFVSGANHSPYLGDFSAHVGQKVEKDQDEGLRPIVLVSFDIDREDHAVRRRISRFLYGYTSTKRVRGVLRIYHYRGVKDAPGTIHVGQSVVLTSPAVAEKVVQKLREARVRFTVLHLFA